MALGLVLHSVFMAYADPLRPMEAAATAAPKGWALVESGKKATVLVAE
jgi:hypothetical protein